MNEMSTRDVLLIAGMLISSERSEKSDKAATKSSSEINGIEFLWQIACTESCSLEKSLTKAFKETKRCLFYWRCLQSQEVAQQSSILLHAIYWKTKHGLNKLLCFGIQLVFLVEILSERFSTEIWVRSNADIIVMNCLCLCNFTHYAWSYYN